MVRDGVECPRCGARSEDGDIEAITGRHPDYSITVKCKKCGYIFSYW